MAEVRVVPVAYRAYLLVVNILHHTDTYEWSCTECPL